MENDKLGPKNKFLLPLKKEGSMITVSSMFDSGNCAKAEIGLNHAVIITPANDCSTSNNPSHSKGWFHFSVSGAPVHTKVKFVIKRVTPMATQVPASLNIVKIRRLLSSRIPHQQRIMATRLASDCICIG